MGRRKIQKRLVRSLSESGGTYRISLPVEIVRFFRWRKKQKLQLRIEKRRKEIIIKDWEKDQKKNSK